MRTSRPLKHAPIPLLGGPSQHKKGGKGKGKGIGKGRGTGKAAASEKNGDADADRSIYSYAPLEKGRGVKQSARRLQSAREDVRASNKASSSSRGKGKGKGRRGGEESEGGDGDEDGDSDAAGGAGIEDNTMDIRNIKFKMGLGSDDELDGQGDAGDDGDDDEEIDSDLAMTDGEEERPPKGRNEAAAKAGRRATAADFYDDNAEQSGGSNDSESGLDNDDGLIDLNEDDAGAGEEDYNSEDDDEIYMDLSEMLDRKDGPASPQRSVANRRTQIKSKQTAETDLKSFRPNLGATEEIDEDESENDDDEEEEDDDEEEDEDEEFSNGSDLDEEDEEDNEAALAKLDSLITNLSGKRSLPAEDDDEEAGSSFPAVSASEAAKKRRRLLLSKERTEAVPEGDFAGNAEGGKLTLDSLLSTLSGAQAKALQKSLKPLQAKRARNGAGADDEDDLIAAEVARLSKDETAILARERARKLASASNAKNNPLKAPGALPAPLAPLHQAKIVRQAAREGQEKVVLKWEDTVKQMRGIDTKDEGGGEQRLVLPLRSGGPGKGVTNAELVAKFNPSNDLERQIASLVASTGMSQSALLATENSALMDALPQSSSGAGSAHDAARVAQLRLARELMFRAERKAKRVAKIKSRTFRKIAKKARNRAAGEEGEGQLSLEEMAQLDALDGGDRMEKERERLETLRARERATLRHASGKSGATAGGRWSKGLRNLDGMDDDVKAAVRSRESKQELLRRKILGNDEAGGSSDDDDDASTVESELDQEDDEAVKLRTMDELAALRSAGSGEKKELPKGLMGMKFMQKALQRQNDRVDSMIDDFDDQFEGRTADDGDDRAGDLVQNNPGRMVFAPSASAASTSASAAQEQPAAAKKRATSARTNGTVSTSADVGSASSNASSSTLVDYNPFSNLSTGNGQAPASFGLGGSKAGKEVNPWLVASKEGPSAATVSRKGNEKIVTKDSRSTEKSSAKLRKEQGKDREVLRKAQNEAKVEIDLDKVLLAKPASAESANAPRSSPPAQDAPTSDLPGTSPASAKRRKNREDAPPPSSAAPASRLLHKGDADDSDEASDNDEDALPEALKKQQNPQAFQQRDLVARAFAGDNVITDFEEMKRAEIEADAPHDEDLTLPGWGSWGGKGVKKSKNAKKVVKHIPGIDASKRKDAKYQNVIISERTDKKAKKYLTKDLPYPYTSKKQYEQRLAQPTGAEWNTRTVHKDMVMPRVLTKPGTVIKPVSKQL